MVTLHKAVDITYNKRVGESGELRRFEHSDRTIIPTTLPSSNIKALDVTDLTEKQVAALEKRLAEYAEYREAIAATAFSFEDWTDLTYGEDANIDINWRTFDDDGLFTR